METFSVVIIGAGPAGLAAAIQLSRQGHQPLVLERDRIGGLLWNANLVENYPGFSQGISGPELVKLFSEHASHLNVPIRMEEARVVDYREGLFRIDTNERELTAQYLVAATGTKANVLPGNLIGNEIEGRIFSEVYPLLNSSKKSVIIIGGGDAAFDYALNLADRNQVIVLARGKEIKALPLLYDRAQAHPGIECHLETEVIIIEEGQNDKLCVEISQKGKHIQLESDYLIGAIGREPDDSFAAPSIMKEINNLQDEGRLFMIGDLKNGLFRQTAIAVGDGLRAAMKIDHLLTRENL